MNFSLVLSDSTKWSADLVPQSQKFIRKPHDFELYNVNLDKQSNGERLGYKYMGDGYRNGPLRDTVVNNSVGMPEVYRLYPGQQTSISCDWLKLWRNINPELSDEKFCTLLGNGYAFTNKTGFPGRRNCILGTNLDQKDPAFHELLVCGGAVLKVLREDSEYFYIDSLLTSGPIPDADKLINELTWLWFYGVTITPTKRNFYMVKNGYDGLPKKIRVPFLTELPVFAPKDWFHVLPEGFIPPSPLWLPS